MRLLKYGEAISEALVQGMERDPNVFIAGIGVDDFKGIFGTTREAFLRFGKHRVFDIPNCENAFTGVAIGAAAMGKRPVIVHPRNDFMFLAMDMVFNLGAKWKYMFATDHGVPIVLRGIVGRGWGQGATHSHSMQSVFAHFPGLYVATPASPADAKGLLLSALSVGAPTVILENRALYEIEGEVAEEPIEIPFGRGRIVKEGRDVTIVGASLMAYEALRAAEVLATRGIDAEVIDPRTIRPLDEEIILGSIQKTGHLVVADTSWAMCGFAAEVAAVAVEKGFSFLRAPVRRVTLPDCPAPVSKPLEDVYHPNPETIAQACLEVLRSEGHALTEISDIQEQFTGPY